MILVAIQFFLNRYFKKYPEMGDLLAGYAGSVVAIESTLPPFKIYLSIQDRRIQCLKQSDHSDAQIRGNGFSVLRMNARQGNAGMQANLDIRGDIKVLLAIQHSLKPLQTDREACLALLIGDTSAHTVSHWLRPLLTELDRLIENFNRNLSAYVQTKKGWLVSKEEMKWLSDEVDALKMAVGRCEAHKSHSVLEQQKRA